MRKIENKHIPLTGTSLEKGRNSAFTLVELIIVITILAILATIGFMSFQTYTSDARDANRITSLGEIRKGLEMYQIKKASLPNPDEKIVTVYSGSIANTIAVQGYVGTEVQKAIRMTSEVKDDETENIYYTYSVNANKTKYQLLAMLEKDPNIAFLSPDFGKSGLGKQVYARMNYESRHPYTIGNYAVFFSGTTNSPLQTISGTGLNLSGNSTQIKAIISGTGTKLFTGSELPKIIEDLTKSKRASSYKFPGEDGISGTADDCDTDNITLLNGQVWSACNLGAKTAYNGSNAGTFNPSGSTTRGGNDNVNGKLYQWGRNKGFASTDTSQQTTALTSNPNGADTYNFVWNSSLASPYDWISPQNNTIWGGQTTDSATVDNVTDKALRQGACPSGWHIPSVKEWKDACDIISGTSCTNNSTTVTAIQTALKLSFAGNRNRDTGYYGGQSTNAYYWSSSPNSTNAYYLYFNASNITPAYFNYRANGFSLRCLKN